jgi:hypothetical protein
MSTTPSEERAGKRTAPESSNPLHHTPILQLVLDLVGLREHIFLSTVSKGFRACYLKVPLIDEEDSDADEDDEDSFPVHHLTSCNAILGSLSRVRLAIELGFVLDTQSRWCQYSAGCAASIETLIELHKQYHMPYTEQVGRGAAESGSVRKLQWLLDEQQCPQAADICSSAASAPTIEILKWLKQRGCVLTADLYADAAMSRFAANTLRYLHHEGVPLNDRAMISAARTQKVPVLQWLYEHGCPLSREAVLSASQRKDPQALSWLHSIGCPCDYYFFVCQVAASHGNISTLRCCKDNGVVEWSPGALSTDMIIAGACGRLNTVKVSARYCIMRASTACASVAV